MAKYDPLRSLLEARRADQVIELDFRSLGALVGGLPMSAFTYREWWSNRDATHSQSRAWGAAGFDATPDLARRSVRFVRARRATG